MEEGTFSLEGKNYSLEDISEKARYIIGHINELNQEEAEVKRKIERLSISTKAFIDLLKEELQSNEEVKEEEA